MSATTTQTRALTTVLPSVLALAAGLAGLAVVFWPECRAALKVWSESTAYGHCYLVAPIAAYLAWDRRDTVIGMVPRPTPSLLVLGLPLPLFWFASERLGIMEFRQFAVLGFVELLFLVVLGWRLFYAMLAPLLYLVFLVPFGAFLTPFLQSFTASFIDVGLSVLGIPHYVSDMLVEISAGNFFVAEACAGLRFLIASIAFGVFYAMLNYRSPKRRVAFIAASIVVPIIANGFRALGIVLLGHILGSAEAAAADHIIYGWVFFSFVMVLLVVAGLPLREAPAPARVRSAEPGATGSAPIPWGAIAVLALASIGPAAAQSFGRAIGPVVMSSMPTIAAPDGCTSTNGDAKPDRSVTMLTCGDRVWTATVQALSPRGTGSMLGESRNRMLGALDPDEISTEPLRDTPPGTGAWQVIVGRQPAHVSGISVWVRGAPARGGIAQRVHQAIDSIVGNDKATMMITVTSRHEGRLMELEARGATAELAKIVGAQSGLDAAIAGLTVVSAH